LCLHVRLRVVDGVEWLDMGGKGKVLREDAVWAGENVCVRWLDICVRGLFRRGLFGGEGRSLEKKIWARFDRCVADSAGIGTMGHERKAVIMGFCSIWLLKALTIHSPFLECNNPYATMIGNKHQD
jgi:hypothetical protein